MSSDWLLVSTATSPRGLPAPANHFLRTVAADLPGRAALVVLSDLGPDGQTGADAVRQTGGAVLTSDRFEPVGRLTTPAVQKTAPEDLAAAAIEFLSAAVARRSVDELADHELQSAIDIIHEQTGHSFRGYKPTSIRRRMTRRMATVAVETPAEYLRRLATTPAEVEALFRDLLIGVTSFFRDPEAFDALEETVIPRLVEQGEREGVVRVWVPACSTGEEAYSIGMMLADARSTAQKTFQVQIFASDIDQHALRYARAGRYPLGIEADVDDDRLQRFFIREPADELNTSFVYRVVPAVRGMLLFSRQNVIADPPLSRIDLVSCRNLLIYLESELQEKVVPLLHYALSPGGYLFIGSSETVGERGTPYFEWVDKSAKIYRSINSSKRSIASSLTPRGLRSLGTLGQDVHRSEVDVHARESGEGRHYSYRELVEQALLRGEIPCAVAVNQDGRVVYIHGRTGLALEPPPGDVGPLNVLEMAREGLEHELRPALAKVAKTKQAARVLGVSTRSNGGSSKIDFTIRPLSSESVEELYLIVFKDASARVRAGSSEAAAQSMRAGDEVEPSRRISELEAALADREYRLETATIELEARNQRLKSLNAEKQSINEELQSINEELETSKEELHSVNEELSSVNIDLEQKVEELYKANNDMNNLLASTGVATIFLDLQLNIMRYTPAATDLVNLRPSDVGRPVGDLVTNFVNGEKMLNEAATVRDTLQPTFSELQTKNGRWFSMRVEPYRTIENATDGLVVTFLEVTEPRRLRSDRRRLHKEVAWLSEGLRMARAFAFMHDRELKYAWASGMRPPGIEHVEVVGRSDDDLFDGQAARTLKAIKEQVIRSGEATSEDVRLTCGGESLTARVRVQPSTDETGQIAHVLGVMTFTRNE